MIASKHSFNKALIIFLCVLLLAVTIFSTTFLALSFHHECSGEDCLICHCIQLIEQYDEAGNFTLPTLPSVSHYLLALVAVIILGTRQYFHPSLISLKVRLNN